jgi:uroporphyrinogen decarboxylase
MNGRQRLETVLAGGLPDRVPVSAWGHLYQQETTAVHLASATVDFYRRYDWDFIKVHSRASYHVEGWGFRYEPSRDANTLHKCLAHPIRTPRDWTSLRPLSLDCPPLAEQLEVLQRIRTEVGKDVPIIMTVFSPMDVADKLVDRDGAMLRSHVDEAPELLKQALEVFAETFSRFVRALAQAGADGIYFSTKWANSGRLEFESYRALAQEADLQVLREAAPMWCNFLHLCEGPIYLAEMADYPAHVLHWDDHHTGNPSYGDALKKVTKTFGGGIPAKLLAQGSPEEIRIAAQAVISQTEGRDLILSPGCSAQMGRTPPENFAALRAASELS